MTLYMPEWNETGSLIEPIDGAEPVFFKDEAGQVHVLFLGDAKGKKDSNPFNPVNPHQIALLN